jgi:hypothetical protein
MPLLFEGYRVIAISLRGQWPGEMAFSPDGTLLGVTSSGVNLRVFDTMTGMLLWSVSGSELPYDPSYGVPVSSTGGPVSFSPDNRYVIQTEVPSEIFEAATGNRVSSLPKKEKPGSKWWPCPFLEPRTHIFLVSPDEQWAVGPGERRGPDLKLYNRTKNKWIVLNLYNVNDEDAKIEFSVSEMEPYAFSPDNSLLACGDENRLYLLQLQELARLKPINLQSEINIPIVSTLTTLKLPRKHFQGAAFTTDGKRLLTISNEATVRVWETTNWSECHAYEWKAGPLRFIAMSSDGTRAAVASTRKIVIWDLDD